MTVTFYITRHGETQFNVENRVQGWCDSPLTAKGIYDAYKLGQGLAGVDFVGACTSDAGRAKDTLAIALEARLNERERLYHGLPIPKEQVRAEEASALLEAGMLGHEEHAEAVIGLLRSRGCLAPRSSVPDSGEMGSAAARLLAAAEAWRPPIDELSRIEYPAFDVGARALDGHAERPIPVRCDESLREWCFGDLEGESSRRLRNRLFDLFGDDIPREDQNERLDEIADYLHATDAAGRAEDFAAIAARVRGFLEECGRSVDRRGGGNVLVVTHAMFIRALVFLFARDRVRTPAKIANASVTKVRWDDGAVTVETIGDVTHLGSRRG